MGDQQLNGVNDRQLNAAISKINKAEQEIINSIQAYLNQRRKTNVNYSNKKSRNKMKSQIDQNRKVDIEKKNIENKLLSIRNINVFKKNGTNNIDLPLAVALLLWGITPTIWKDSRQGSGDPQVTNGSELQDESGQSQNIRRLMKKIQNLYKPKKQVTKKQASKAVKPVTKKQVSKKQASKVAKAATKKPTKKQVFMI